MRPSSALSSCVTMARNNANVKVCFQLEEQIIDPYQYCGHLLDEKVIGMLNLFKRKSYLNQRETDVHLAVEYHDLQCLMSKLVSYFTRAHLSTSHRGLQFSMIQLIL
jgi:hypothetical protein